MTASFKVRRGHRAFMLLMLFLGTACENRTVTLFRPDTASVDTTGTESPASTDEETPPPSDSDTDSDSGDIAARCVLREQIRIRSVPLSQAAIANESEVALKPLTISAIPSGGSRVGWMGEDGHLHITTLDKDDLPTGEITLPAFDYQDILATDDGGAALLTRDAQGGGTGNCGDASFLCVPPTEPVNCADMVLVRFDGSGERWAAKLTSSSDVLPPYSTSPTGPSVTMIWWYAHHGRIASNGDTFAAIFGSAISATTGECINIYQGDRMRVVDADGAVIDGGFNWGCSPSGYERVVWNPNAHAFAAMCKTLRTVDGTESGLVAFAPDKTPIRVVDPHYANVSDVVPATNGGYWMAVSDRKDGQPERSPGLAQVHLIRFTSNESDIEHVIPSLPAENARAPHLAAWGENALLLAWETAETPGDLSESGARTLWIQARDMETGEALSDAVAVPEITGNRYQSLRAFPDGSAAFAARGKTDSEIQIMRILPCDNNWRQP